MCSYADFCCVLFFFFKQKTAYEMRISDWSSDVCSSDLGAAEPVGVGDLADAVDLADARQQRHRQGLDERQPRLGLQPLRAVRALTGLGEAGAHAVEQAEQQEIGRASCRERVCQYV